MLWKRLGKQASHNWSHNREEKGSEWIKSNYFFFNAMQAWGRKPLLIALPGLFLSISNTSPEKISSRKPPRLWVTLHLDETVEFILKTLAFAWQSQHLIDKSREGRPYEIFLVKLFDIDSRVNILLGSTIMFGLGYQIRCRMFFWA